MKLEIAKTNLKNYIKMEIKNILVFTKGFGDGDVVSKSTELSKERLEVVKEFITELIKRLKDKNVSLSDDFDIDDYFTEEELEGKYEKGLDLFYEYSPSIEGDDYGYTVNIELLKVIDKEVIF